MPDFRGIVVGVVIGIAAIGLARFAFAPWEHPVHFHADWAVFIDGARLDLSDDRYMEDVLACAAGEQVFPHERVHMHGGIDHIVHVHHEGVAWGHLLQNLGFAAGPDFLILADQRALAPDGARSLKYVLNGFVVDDAPSRLIRPGDRLLVSYGAESADQVLAEQFPLVPADAPRYDELPDPAACAGATRLGTGERLRRAFWW